MTDTQREPAKRPDRTVRERVARFRAKHPRFDWTPSDEALRVFDEHRRAHPTLSASAVLDRLVVLAHRAVTGNLKR
ncbi:hypothetical protein [Aquabacterium sp.]|uniref:hypothetical protein n=1 Tax=Aquabacterium sp. TaxID=1872578 RepID=UPI003783B336